MAVVLLEADLSCCSALEDSLPVPCVLGIDPGTTSCGLALLALPDHPGAPDRLLAAAVLHGSSGSPLERIVTLKRLLAKMVHLHSPRLIAIESYDWHGKVTTQQQWMAFLVGALLDLGDQATPPCPVQLFAVGDWRRSLIGSGGVHDKQAAKRIVQMRLGVRFQEPGLHAMDAAGLALVALDTWRLQQAAQEVN